MLGEPNEMHQNIPLNARMVKMLRDLGVGFRERVYEHGSWWVCTNCQSCGSSFTATYRVSAYQTSEPPYSHYG